MSTPTTTTQKVIHTIKLVVIGASGVGKTSLRGQYISGRFTSGYRATIGTDFIAKTLPHPTKPEQNVTLQIWDTAGQERFSSLSTAFFRGADAVLLMFDIHQDESLDALQKWWAEFCGALPLLEEDMLEYPCFVVGNKIDLVTEDVVDDGGDRVSEYRETRVSGDRIQRFLNQLIPNDHDQDYSSDDGGGDGDDDDEAASPVSPPTSVSTQPNGTTTTTTTTTSPAPTSPIIQTRRSPSIDIKPPPSPVIEDIKPPKKSFKDQARLLRSDESTSHQFNTTSSLNSTTTSVYLTPSSSLFSNTIFHTARSSPEPSLSVSSPSPLSSMVTRIPPPPPSGGSTSPLATTSKGTGMSPVVRQRRLTNLSTGSASSESAATITPSSFARREREGVKPKTDHNPSFSNGTSTTKRVTTKTKTTATTSSKDPTLSPDPSNPPLSASTQVQQQQPHSQLLQLLPPPRPERGPSLHFTSAKTGEGVRELFEHVAERVIRRLEYEEYFEARGMHYRETSGAETIRLGGAVGAGSGAGSRMEARGHKRKYERCCT